MKGLLVCVGILGVASICPWRGAGDAACRRAREAYQEAELPPDSPYFILGGHPDAIDVVVKGAG